jgi:hypothetical protein
MFWNSSLWTPFETLERVNQRKPLGIFIGNEGPRLFYGDATILIACHVKDLRIERESSGKVVMEWTAPAGTSIDRKAGKIVPVGEPTRRRYEGND